MTEIERATILLDMLQSTRMESAVDQYGHFVHKPVSVLTEDEQITVKVKLFNILGING